MILKNRLRRSKKDVIEKAYIHYNQYYSMPTIYVSATDMYWVHQCYASCGAEEVLRIIENLDDIGFLLDALQAFMETCLDMACETTGDVSFMFSVYADVVVDFIDLYL